MGIRITRLNPGILTGMLIGILFIAMISLGLGIKIAQAAEYQDIDSSNADLSYIQYLTGKRIISGYPDGSFKPQEGLTRAQAAVVMVKAGNITVDPAAPSPFKDVNKDHWARSYIAAAVKAGYVSGYPDGSFQPDQKLTRAQGIALLLKLSQQPQNANLPELKDINKQHWAAQAVAVGLAAGMVSLSNNEQNYYPEAPFSRMNMAHALGILLTEDPVLSTSSLTGQIKNIKGKVKIQKAGSNLEEELKTAATISAGDTISTEKGASAQINFPDGSSLLIKEETQIKIKEAKGKKYVKIKGQEGIAVDWLNLDIKKGTMLAALSTKNEPTESLSPDKPVTSQKGLNIASLNGMEYIAAAAQSSQKDMPWYETSKTKKVKVKVDMPWGVAAIRGTVIKITLDNTGKATVECYSGKTEVTNNGKTVLVGENQKTQVDHTNDPTLPEKTETKLDTQDTKWQSEFYEAEYDNRDAGNVPASETGSGKEDEGPAPNNGATGGNTNTGANHGSSPISITRINDLNYTIRIGESFTLPASVDAQMSDGYMRSKPITWATWANGVPDLNQVGGPYTITGTVSSYSGVVKLTLTIKERATILSIDDITVVASGAGSYVLPEKVSAKMSNNDTDLKAITWYADQADTSQAGVIKIKGRVDGYAPYVMLTIYIEKRIGQTVPVVKGVPLLFAGGIKIDLGDMEIPAGATLKVELVTEPNLSQSGLTVGGSILKIEFDNLNITQPVEITLPLNDSADGSKAGIYYYNNVAGTWEYQNSVLANRVLKATVSHFSIYGVLLDSIAPNSLKLEVGAKTRNSIELLFSAHDNVKIRAYEIYRDGTKVATATETHYTDSNLEAGKEYSYQIKAIDIFANQSELSENLTVKAGSDKKEILSFSLPEQNQAALINKEDYSISIAVKKGTDLSKLSPAITVSEGATVSPASGERQDFRSPFNYIVKAQDESQQTWTVKVSVAKSNDAGLSSLNLSGAVLSSSFNKDLLSYISNVGYYVSSVSLSATTIDADASISINGASPTVATASGSVALNTGSNTISVAVTAEDGTTSRTYTISIIRDEAPPPPPPPPEIIGAIGPLTRAAGWSSQKIIIEPGGNEKSLSLYLTPGDAALTLGNADNAVCTVMEYVYGSSRSLKIQPKTDCGSVNVSVTASSPAGSDTATFGIMALYLVDKNITGSIDVGYSNMEITLTGNTSHPTIWTNDDTSSLSIEIRSGPPDGALVQTVGTVSNVGSNTLTFALPTGLPAGQYSLNVVHNARGTLAASFIDIQLT